MSPLGWIVVALGAWFGIAFILLGVWMGLTNYHIRKNSKGLDTHTSATFQELQDGFSATV
jgi:hypothetical protein